jgi:2-keto-4-pentenoate hydratase/2-oxohepta-3-ene-1,7-dioic acid hydratase in catechol pathway
VHGKSAVETAAVYGSDWEVELDIVIDNEARYVNKANKMNHFARYCVINDLYERAFQIKKSRHWVKGKLADTFRPTGPWLGTKDEIADPQNLMT